KVLQVRRNIYFPYQLFQYKQYTKDYFFLSGLFGLTNAFIASSNVDYKEGYADNLLPETEKHIICCVI
ncbi:MAG TPA: hypothetical protein VN958_20525, partial [Chitinophagaceae bacterium]|nr:hypothetical protein [Chitinophagaceae bacterium]